MARFFARGNGKSTLGIDEACQRLEADEGRIAVRRAYGSAENLKGLVDVLRAWAIRPFVNLSLFKNTTDIALAVDAMELACQTPSPTVVALGSGDADFMPLVLRLRERGIRMLCVSERGKMAQEAAHAYDQVIFVGAEQASNETLGAASDIDANFRAHFRTKETADLFLALFIRLLKPGGRAAIVLPDGSLFGEGVKTRLKEHLMSECNLHTIVRLPNSVFRPYASIGTNLLFFKKGEPTKDIWFYEHQVPAGQKAYSMTRPIRVEHLQGCVDWWGGAERVGRQETPQAWRVTAHEVKARGYNLDIKNPHSVADDHGDPAELLAALDAAEVETAKLRSQLKDILAEALAR